MVARALEARGIHHTRERDPANRGLDFHLAGRDVHVEVKRFHTPRISDQASRSEALIVLQGERAVRLFCHLLDPGGTP
ncbi:hypothetical protein ELZ22_17130 [Brucella abortus]|nr:hypothetical protein ELZ22_17130 [Brucella abortus]RUQ96520.1 hypothetical protein ELZ21_15535 [Brucella abortus]